MKPLGDPRDHYWLAQRMAKTAGLDLVQAGKEGMLDQDNWAQMVQTCRGCEWVGGCERFLNREHKVEAVPLSCANCQSFAALVGADVQRSDAKD